MFFLLLLLLLFSSFIIVIFIQNENIFGINIPLAELSIISI